MPRLRCSTSALHDLNARDRAILKLRYAESKPFHVIGHMLGLSESRVCQLHKRILVDATAPARVAARGSCLTPTARRPPADTHLSPEAAISYLAVAC